MRTALRALLLIALTALGLELFFVARIAALAVLDPASTSFQRSEMWRLASLRGAPQVLTQGLPWHQQWVPYDQLGGAIKRAVVASEDDGFIHHEGVDWDAMEKAWQKNAQTQEQLARLERQRAKAKAQGKQASPSAGAAAPAPARQPKLVGGSTITQQLAKNLLLSGERNLARKGQELLLTFALETFLSKRRILELYLNHVEWGEGVFGAEAAARHYYGKSARALSPWEAARLAVMLPSPKRYERTPGSTYLSARASAVAARMGDALVP